jgi:hypothetical protein
VRLICKHLNIKKTDANLVLTNISVEQKMRKGISSDLSARMSEEPNLLEKAVIGDET